MPGLKQFTNHSPYPLSVTLVVRAGDDPRDHGTNTTFSLDSKETQWQSYGDDTNIYLNGIRLSATVPGEIDAQQAIVITRGSPLDDALNTKNAVDFNFDQQQWSFTLSTRQV